jgi:hypothetical protein
MVTLPLAVVLLASVIPATPLIVVVEPAVVEPTVTVWLAAPVPTLTVRAWAPVPMLIVPVPEAMVTAELLVALPMLTALALVLPRLTAAAPPASRVRVLAPVELTLRAPLAVRVVEVPRLTVPEPPCRVRLPAVVLQVEAAAAVRVRAPEEVAIDEALRPDRARAPEVPVTLTAPVVTVKPLLAVSNWLEVNEPLLVVVIPFLPRETEVAVLVPRLRAPAVATSRVGVRMLVSLRPVPDIQKTAVCWAAFWFWM